MEIRETAGRVFIDNKRSSHQEIPPGAVLLNCGSTTPLFVGWAVPLIQMSNQMLLSPVSKLGVYIVQLPTLELSFLFFIRNLKEDTADKDFNLDFRNKPRLSYDVVRLGETLSKRLWCMVLCARKAFHKAK